MKSSYKLGLTAIAASLALVGCGGGGGSDGVPEVQGNLYNTYVSGAKYVCKPSGRTGITDNKGTYTCNLGDTVEFFLGNYPIGSATAAEGILDTDNLSSNNAADTDLLQLLQGIDDESDGVITIPANFDALDDFNVSLGDQNFETLFDNFVTTTDANITLEDETTAVDNHAENLLQVYLGDKTVYTAEKDNFLKSVSFDTNLTEMNTTVIAGTGEGNFDSAQPTLENGGLLVPGLGFLVLTEKTEDYLLFSYNTDKTIKFYFDEAQAQAVFYPYIPMTTAMLSGKVFYADAGSDFEMISFISSTEVNFREILLDTNGSIWYDSGDFAYPYSINALGELIIDLGFGETNTYKLINTTATQWNMVKNGDATSPYSTWLLNAPSNFPTLETAPAEPIVTEPTQTDAELLKTMLAGNTWVKSTGFTLTFNADVTVVSVLEVGASAPFDDNVVLDGMTLTHSDGTDTIAIVNETTLVFNGNETFTLQTASTPMDPTPTDAELLKTMLAGNTWVNSITGFALTFNADVTVVSILDAGASAPFDDNVVLDGMTLTHSGGTDTIAIVNETTIVFNGNETFTLQSGTTPGATPATDAELLKTMLAGNVWKGPYTWYKYNEDVTILSLFVGAYFPGSDYNVVLDGMTHTWSGETTTITIVNETTLIFNTPSIGEEWFTLVPTVTNTFPLLPSEPTITDPAAATALESAVSGNLFILDSQDFLHFYADGSYYENIAGVQCSGKWAVIGDNYIAATCGETGVPEYIDVPTSTADANVVIKFLDTPVDGGSITHYKSEESLDPTSLNPDIAADPAVIDLTITSVQLL